MADRFGQTPGRLRARYWTRSCSCKPEDRAAGPSGGTRQTRWGAIWSVPRGELGEYGQRMLAIRYVSELSHRGGLTILLTRNRPLPHEMNHGSATSGGSAEESCGIHLGW